MFVLLAAILLTFSAARCDNQRYTTVKHRTLIQSNVNGPIYLIYAEGYWPSFINFTQPIARGSGIEVKVAFTNDSGPMDYAINGTRRYDICRVLDVAIDHPNSYEAKLMMAESLGLYGTRCPIKAGVRNLSPYSFPRTVDLDDSFGAGFRTYVFTVEDANEHTVLLKLEADLDFQLNSSPLLLPSVAVVLPLLSTLALTK